MVQLLSTPPTRPTLPQRAKPAPLGDAFASLGERVFGDMTAPAQPSAPPAAAPIGASIGVAPSAGAPSDLLARTAAEYGLDPKTFTRIAQIESGGNPNAVTGSYRGLFQLRDGSFDPMENARAAGAKLAEESRAFAAQYGRPPAPYELYMVHQQGAGGYAAHAANPDAPAWQNMGGTAEGRQKGPGWARQAIWGNVPTQFRAQFGDVNNITSRQFLDMWRRKFGT